MKNIELTLSSPENENQIHIEQLSNILDGSCDTLELMAILDYYPNRNRQEIFNTAISKIKYGGTISLSGLDIIEVARQIYTGNIQEQEASNILYKEGSNNRRCSSSSLMEVINILQASNFTILVKDIDSNAYSVQARRNFPDTHSV